MIWSLLLESKQPSVTPRPSFGGRRNSCGVQSPGLGKGSGTAPTQGCDAHLQGQAVGLCLETDFLRAAVVLGTKRFGFFACLLKD